MAGFSRSRLAVGVIGCLVVGVLLQTVKLQLPGGPVWQTGQILLDVSFWFVIVVGAILALQAAGFSFATVIGGSPAAKPGLMLGAGIALGAVFALGVATRNWVVFSNPELPGWGFVSLVIDPVFALLEAMSGALLALASLALLTERAAGRGARKARQRPTAGQ